MAIQVLKPKFHVDECLEQVKECLEKGWTGMGFKTIEFEEEWKKYTGHKYAYFLNSNTVGLHLAVKILKMNNCWNDGDEIISTPITFVSTNLALKPVSVFNPPNTTQINSKSSFFATETKQFLASEV